MHVDLLVLTTRAGDLQVVVAVVDSGVGPHVDLANVMWVNQGEIPGNGIDDDGNGRFISIYIQIKDMLRFIDCLFLLSSTLCMQLPVVAS